MKVLSGRTVMSADFDIDQSQLGGAKVGSRIAYLASCPKIYIISSGRSEAIYALTLPGKYQHITRRLPL
jgi:hypothetical protein